MARALAGASLVATCLACTGSRKDPRAAEEESTRSVDAAVHQPAVSAPAVSAAPPPVHETGAAEMDASPAPQRTTALEVARVLFADAADPAVHPWSTECAPALPEEARIRCAFGVRYAGDPEAARLAHGLFVRHGVRAGVEVAHVMNGGYRGMIQIVPAVPTKQHRRHLAWIDAAFADFEAFFEGLGRGDAGVPRYRFRPIDVRFMRSVRATTPNAYASGWEVAYNLDGSINLSESAVRETMFHEIFHLNDTHHGEFSLKSLSRVYDAIVKRCGTRSPCLQPYSPGDTMVRNGTYYPFQPGNDVREYGAELAIRYYREQRLAIRGEKVARPFKCGPRENAEVWAAFAGEFFAGIDRIPACP